MELSLGEFLEQRKASVNPVAEDFKTWLDEKARTQRLTSNLGQAVSYALSQWENVMHYLDHPDLTPDNKVAENAIRPFVLGRKNWLYSGSPEGAKSSCFMFSLIETALLNKFNPYGYIQLVFSRTPEIRKAGTWE